MSWRVIAQFFPEVHVLFMQGGLKRPRKSAETWQFVLHAARTFVVQHVMTQSDVCARSPDRRGMIVTDRSEASLPKRCNPRMQTKMALFPPRESPSNAAIVFPPSRCIWPRKPLRTISHHVITRWVRSSGLLPSWRTRHQETLSSAQDQGDDLLNGSLGCMLELIQSSVSVKKGWHA